MEPSLAKATLFLVTGQAVQIPTTDANSLNALTSGEGGVVVIETPDRSYRVNLDHVMLASVETVTSEQAEVEGLDPKLRSMLESTNDA